MEQVFGYIIGLGAAVMMPIIFTILGVCIGIKFSKALKSGLLVGVGFVGLSVVTALLTSSLGPALSQVVEIYGLQLKVFDMGWPAAAAVAYNTSVGAFIIPVCLGVNLLMLLTKTTRTVNIDLWNYWHFAFIGAVVYFASDNIWWGFFAAIICYIITLIMADYTADKFQGFYDKMEGISIPQPFCAGFVPFAVVINKALDKIPGFDKLNIDAEGMKKKFGLLGEPLFLGILVGCGIGALSCKNGQELVDKIPYILGLAKRKPVPTHIRTSGTFLLLYIVHTVPQTANIMISRRETCFFLISIHEFIPRNPSTHISFTPFISIYISPAKFSHTCYMLPFPKQRKLLPVLPNVSAHCRTPDYGICFPVP